jgi:predicted nucleotidyltransferase
MRTRPPSLLPIFRSDGQARLLARLFLRPDVPASLSELAREIGRDPASVQREVAQLELAGILKTERIGGARIVRPDKDSPIHDEMERLVLKTLGPAVVLARALAAVGGIEYAFVFGSWAQRMMGEEGPAPADIDLLVVGTPDRRALSRACRAAGDELGREVGAVVVVPVDWETRATGFIRSIREGALIPIAVPTAAP